MCIHREMGYFDILISFECPFRSKDVEVGNKYMRCWYHHHVLPITSKYTNGRILILKPSFNFALSEWYFSSQGDAYFFGADHVGKNISICDYIKFFMCRKVGCEGVNRWLISSLWNDLSRYCVWSPHVQLPAIKITNRLAIIRMRFILILRHALNIR